MSKEATQLKYSWIEMPDECFEPLTFGELQKGDRFICLPLPGDNVGHGGFRGTHYIFEKLEDMVPAEALPGGREYGIPHGEAVAESTGTISHFPHSMYVINVR